ncbi:MAG TPA: ATP-binding protein, partial [Verrucomicrobiae bacterium]|nr:ATP-binding protein [Verrucomicrobiae bacterium]
ARDKVRRNEEQLRLLTDNLPALIGYLDRNLTYRLPNKRHREWFGSLDLEGRPIAEFLDPESMNQCEPYIRQALEGIPQRFECLTVHQTLGPRHTEITYVPDVSTEGKVCGFYVFVVDIHDLKQTQIELERTRASLEDIVMQRTARLTETIGELEAFSYSISHDMRSPLRAMEGFSKALLQDHAHKLDDEGKDLLRRIEKGAHRLDLLIQDVLAYSRVAKGSFELRSVDLQSLVDETIKNFEFQQSAIQVLKPLPTVKAHEALLSQILSNLLGNAAKFAKRDVSPEIRISAKPDGDKVKISVSDNGIGIEPAHFQRIFEIFGRVHADKLYPGTGIGLAIVKKAVERLGGKVGVESSPGQGSTFWFTLTPV